METTITVSGVEMEVKASIVTEADGTIEDIEIEKVTIPNYNGCVYDLFCREVKDEIKNKIRIDIESEEPENYGEDR